MWDAAQGAAKAAGARQHQNNHGSVRSCDPESLDQVVRQWGCLNESAVLRQNGVKME